VEIERKWTAAPMLALQQVQELFGVAWLARELARGLEAAEVSPSEAKRFSPCLALRSSSTR
jgi:hypothetical protein